MVHTGPTAAAQKTQAIEDQSPMMLRKYLAMAGGDGDKSYAKASFNQQTINDLASSILMSCLEKVNLPAADEGTFSIADLGCSSGPNTIKIVSHAVKKLKELYQKRGQHGPEFTAYFNDLPSTDFNVLFQQLDSESRDFYYAGLPGTFHGRLLPRSSVNLVLSTHTLHWISQIPPAVTDKNSSAYNKGRIWVHGSNPHVVKAYKQQGVDDMRCFLDARAEELVPGGLLFCVIISAAESTGDSAEIWLRPLSEDKSSTRVSLMRIFEYVWDELISEGIVSEDQRAACNIPWSLLTRDEVEEILKSYDDIFQTECLEHVVFPATLVSGSGVTAESEVESNMRLFASVFGPLLSHTIGEDLTSILFNRVAKLSVEKRKAGIREDTLFHVLALTRK